MKKLYNETIKYKCIESSSQSYKYIFLRLFRASATMEEKLQRDLYTFSVLEVLQLYDYIGVNTLNILTSINSALRSYLKFVLSNNINGPKERVYISEIYNIDQNVLKNHINNVAQDMYILTKEQVVQIAKECYNASDSFLVLALFEGIRGNGQEELRNICKKDFFVKDDKYYVSLCTGRTIEISFMLYNWGMQACDDYVYVTPYGKNGAFREMKLEENSDCVIKPRKTSKTKDALRIIDYRFRKLTKEQDIDYYVSMQSIYDSGRVDYLKKRAEEKGITVMDCFGNKEIMIEMYKYYCNEDLGKLSATKQAVKISNFIKTFKDAVR